VIIIASMLWVFPCIWCISMVTVISVKSHILQNVIVCLCLYVKLPQECCMYMFKLQKRKFMWHSSVDYWVCYHMFCSKRMEVFPRIAWPGLFKARDVTNWCQSMRDFSGVTFPDLRLAGGCYKLVSEL
jgi:hypothetical protein